MARQDTTVVMRKSYPQRRLQYLLNETYVKFDELKELLRKEASLTGSRGYDVTISSLFSRQDYLVTLCAEIYSEQERKNGGSGGPPGAKGASGNARARLTFSNPPPAPAIVNQHVVTVKSERDDAKSDASWYGSLDRSLAKKKKHQLMDKRRRHTKTIGSMGGLDIIKKSAELQPDEQYEIGLPAAPRIISTRSSIFPMTQHQYYTALMESKMGRKHNYPLDIRPAPPQTPQVPPQTLPPLPSHSSVHSSWGYAHPTIVETLDENKNMRKPQQSSSSSSPVVPNLRPNVMSGRNLGNELAFRYSGKSSKKWYETNLDDCPPTPTTQNPSPSPSMLSSTRGSSRGSVASGMDTVDGGLARLAVSSPANESTEFTSKSSESSESWAGTGNEVTKPFEMSDYYKYSTKYRSRNSPVSEEGNQSDRRSVNGISSSTPSTIVHSRQSSRQASFDATNGYRDTNGNPSVGPKLPPKQRRNQNRSMSSSSVIFEGDITNGGDPTKDIWITNEPTFV